MSDLEIPHNRLLSDQVCDLIERQIVSGELSVGGRLPTEMELAERYQVSRTVIREALKALKEKGWVEARAGKGTYFVGNPGRGVDASLELVLRLNPDGGFFHLLEVRECLEPELAARAALKASDKQIGEMQQLIITMEQALLGEGALEDFLTADVQLHNLLAKATGNPLLVVLVGALERMMQAQQRVISFQVEGGSRRALHHHRLIVAAIRARSPDDAREEMRKHIHQVKADILGLRNSSL